MRHRRKTHLLVALITVAVLAAAAGCSSDGGGDDAEGPGTTKPSCPHPDGTTIAVPDDCPTIQAAVDVAEPGDLVLISPGT